MVDITKTDIWTFVHEPKCLNDMVLADDVRRILTKVLKEIPNVMLIGKPGIGKGTFTNIFLKETGLDYLWVNGGDEKDIETMRGKVKTFATALGLTPLKVVVINEFDAILGPPQKMLLELLERVQSITRFILLCNHGVNIKDEIYSRFQMIEMSNPPIEKIAQHCLKVLKAENVKVKNNKEIADMIKKLYPDMRKMINTLQMNTIGGVIDTIKVLDLTEIYESVLVYITKNDIENVRKILKSYPIDYSDLYQHLYENVDRFSKPGEMVILIGEYLYRSSFVSIQEINFMTMFFLAMKTKAL